MADVVDQAQETEESIVAAKAKHTQPYVLPKGTPGECLYCGEDSQRLINFTCAPCRDRRGLK